MTLHAFAACAPGLESVLAAECAALGLTPHRDSAGAALKGGVGLVEELPALARANRELRTASRILVRVGMPFYARTFEELIGRGARLPWSRFLKPGAPVAWRVTCRGSRLFHSDAVAERLHLALSQALGVEPPLAPFDEDRGGEAQLIVVRLVDDVCTVSVDSSGPHLHRRGYRLATAKAPLRETLAAAMLLAAGWDPTQPLIDPFCGSGTIPIEAALLASGRAPNAARTLPLNRWPCAKGLPVGAATSVHRPAPAAPLIIASDRDAGAITAARDNAKRAGVAEWIDFRQHSVSDLKPPLGHGWVITNPPYGQRVGGPDLRNLYARFGAVLREQCPEWSACLLANDPALIRQTHLALSPLWYSDNGGLTVGAFAGSIRA